MISNELGCRYKCTGRGLIKRHQEAVGATMPQVFDAVTRTLVVELSYLSYLCRPMWCVHGRACLGKYPSNPARSGAAPARPGRRLPAVVDGRTEGPRVTMRLCLVAASTTASISIHAPNCTALFSLYAHNTRRRSALVCV